MDKKLIGFIVVMILSNSAFAVFKGKPHPTNQPLEMSLRERLTGFSIGAHQGGAKGRSFNNLPHFEKARLEGADIVEMDLRTSKDGVPVIYHDETLNRWTKCKGKLNEMNLEDLQKCKFKYNAHSIPSFEQVLEWSRGRIVINAEFKDRESIEPALKLVQKYNAYEWVYFQCQSSREKYELVRSRDPKVVLQYDIKDEEDLDYVIELNDEQLLLIEVHAHTRTPMIIKKIHESGKLVTENTWHFVKFGEFFDTACYKPYSLGIDVGITNDVSGCIKDRMWVEEQLKKGVGIDEIRRGPKHCLKGAC